PAARRPSIVAAVSVAQPPSDSARATTAKNLISCQILSGVRHVLQQALNLVRSTLARLAPAELRIRQVEPEVGREVVVAGNDQPPVKGGLSLPVPGCDFCREIQYFRMIRLEIHRADLKARQLWQRNSTSSP